MDRDFKHKDLIDKTGKFSRTIYKMKYDENATNDIALKIY